MIFGSTLKQVKNDLLTKKITRPSGILSWVSSTTAHFITFHLNYASTF